MTQQDPRTNHGFNYSSGMLQGWNQFCFTGGYIEVAINLPGRPDVQGFWRECNQQRQTACLTDRFLSQLARGRWAI